jgi:transposase
VLFPSCAGLDVHQRSVLACRIPPDPTGQQADGLMERKEVGPLTGDWLALSDWLTEVGITQVAMERTGEYWKPGLNLLAGTWPVFLVHASQVTRVPGRKTDPADARWLARLLRYGLRQASFSPPQGQRAWRDLTRDRTTLVPERSRAVNRGQGVLERAHSTLASGATDMMGMSGRAILAAWIEGRADPAPMAALATRRLRSKLPLLEPALTGLVREHHRRLLAIHWAPIDVLDEHLEALRGAMTRCLTAWRVEAALPPPSASSARADRAAEPAVPAMPLTCTRAIARLDTIPGMDHRGAERWVAETGIDLARFGTAARLAAWAGVAPGNDERAGNQRSGRTRPGHHPLRTVLTQMAHAAAHTQGTSLSTLSHRLAARRGKKRAMVAVAHSLVVSAFYRLVRQDPDQELGATSFDAQQRHHLVDRLTRRIAQLGYEVRLEPLPTPAA